MSCTAPIRAKRPDLVKTGEEGYILLGAIILVAIFVIALAVAAPRVAKEIQRDRDLETMHRGRQYIRAIQLYYHKFNAYPPNIDALVKTNEIRFLRKRYIDPTTGKDDWKPIFIGQNKTPMAMGFFGQPLAGTGGNVIAGTGPSGGNGVDNGSSSSGGIFGGSTIGSPTSGTTGIGLSSGSTGTTGGTDSSGGSNGTTTTGLGSNGPGSSGSGLGSSSSGTFGGGGMIGVAPMSPKQSIIVYKKMNHYSQWEFLYSPMSEMQMIPGGSGSSTLGGSSTGTSGSTFGGSPGFGGTSGGGVGGGVGAPQPQQPPQSPQQ